MKKTVNNPAMTYHTQGQHHSLGSYKRTSEGRINLTMYKSYEYKTDESLNILIGSFSFT